KTSNVPDSLDISTERRLKKFGHARFPREPMTLPLHSRTANCSVRSVPVKECFARRFGRTERGTEHVLMTPPCPCASRSRASDSLQHVGKRIDYGVLLRLGHLREQWEREALARDPLGHREVAGLVAEEPVRRLEVNRDRVVQTGLDAAFFQFRPDTV